METIVRKAEIRDYDACKGILDQIQIMHVNWRPDIYRPNENLLTEENFKQIVEDGNFYVADLDGKVVGILEVMFRHIENPSHVTRDVIFVETLAVDSNYREKGIGHLLLDKTKELQKSSGADGIELQVNAKNTLAFNMYKHYGFTEKSINMELI